MSYCIDRDQDQRLEQDECIEEIYLSGISDAADGIFPQMAELVYLQGYAKGMKDYPRREVVLPVINRDEQNYPLVCGQCAYLANGICGVNGIAASSNKFACDRILVDSPF